MMHLLTVIEMPVFVLFILIHVFPTSVRRIPPAALGILKKQRDINLESKGYCIIGHLTFNFELLFIFIHVIDKISPIEEKYLKIYFLTIFTVSLAGAERVDASEPVELDKESASLTGSRNVSLIHLR